MIWMDQNLEDFARPSLSNGLHGEEWQYCSVLQISKQNMCSVRAVEGWCKYAPLHV
jgi:hypothetical protein